MSTEITYIGGAPAFSVSQFSDVLNRILKGSFDDGLWIEGEIEGMRKPNPHAFFTLVEVVGSKKVCANVKIWANPLRNVQAKLRSQGIELKDGLKVRLYGKLDYYDGQAKLSLDVSDVDTQFSVGEVAAKRDLLLRALLEKGVDRVNKAVPVPLVPLRLGVISSSQAAGWADAQQHLRESGIGFQVTFCDVRVQGPDAVPQIVAALNTFSRRDDIDIVMLMRGGGAKGDLAAFDEESVAMAVSRCAHPVFTGIGHDIDVSIADVMASSSHKTPTACAQAVITLVEDFLGDLSYSASTLRTRTERSLMGARHRLGRCVDHIRSRPHLVLDRQSQKLKMCAESVRLLDPATTMARGWSITRDSAGNIVRSKNDVAPGQQIVTLLADGSVTSTVEETT